MKEYYVHYHYKPGYENFSVSNKEGKTIIYPDGGSTDFICILVEELLLPEKEQVKITVDTKLPDYYARAIELFVKFYNLIPAEKKPIND